MGPFNEPYKGPFRGPNQPETKPANFRQQIQQQIQNTLQPAKETPTIQNRFQTGQEETQASQEETPTSQKTPASHLRHLNKSVVVTTCGVMKNSSVMFRGPLQQLHPTIFMDVTYDIGNG